MNAHCCTEKFKLEWSRYKLASSNSPIFQMPLNPDNMADTWKWMVGLIDTYLYQFRLIPEQFDMTRIMQAMYLETEDFTGLSDLIKHLETLRATPYDSLFPPTERARRRARSLARNLLHAHALTGGGRKSVIARPR